MPKWLFAISVAISAGLAIATGTKCRKALVRTRLISAILASASRCGVRHTNATTSLRICTGAPASIVAACSLVLCATQSRAARLASARQAVKLLRRCRRLRLVHLYSCACFFRRAPTIGSKRAFIPAHGHGCTHSFQITTKIRGTYSSPYLCVFVITLLTVVHSDARLLTAPRVAATRR